MSSYGLDHQAHLHNTTLLPLSSLAFAAATPFHAPYTSHPSQWTLNSSAHSFFSSSHLNLYQHPSKTLAPRNSSFIVSTKTCNHYSSFTHSLNTHPTFISKPTSPPSQHHHLSNLKMQVGSNYDMDSSWDIERRSGRNTRGGSGSGSQRYSRGGGGDGSRSTSAFRGARQQFNSQRSSPGGPVTRSQTYNDQNDFSSNSSSSSRGPRNQRRTNPYVSEKAKQMYFDDDQDPDNNDGDHFSSYPRTRGGTRGGSQRQFSSRGGRNNPAFQQRQSPADRKQVVSGKVLAFTRSKKAVNEHNVIVVGKLENHKWMKMCFGCGAYIGSPTRRGGNLDDEPVRTTTTSSNKPYRAAGLSDMDLCPRCKGLEKSSYQDARDAIGNMDMAVFENQLATIKFKKILVVLVIDATDPMGSLISWKKLRLIVGPNPIFVAVTKCDLLPKVTKQMVDEWYELCIRMYGVNVVKVFPLSGLTRGGVFKMARNMYKYLEGKTHNVYVIGQANIGKSTLAKALSYTFFNHIFFTDPRGVGRKKAFSHLMPTVSSLPGTTLMCIRIPCFDDPNHAIWDTPGLIPRPVPWVQNRLELAAPKMMTPTEYTAKEGDSMVIGYPGECMVRIDVHRLAPLMPVRVVRMFVWQAPAKIDVPIRIMKTSDAQEEVPEDPSILRSIITPEDQIMEFNVNPRGSDPNQDLVLGGLGWIAIGTKRDAAIIKVYAKRSANADLSLRRAVYDPYIPLEDLPKLDPGYVRDPIDYDFSRRTAILEANKKVGIYFNYEDAKEMIDAGMQDVPGFGDNDFGPLEKDVELDQEENEIEAGKRSKFKRESQRGDENYLFGGGVVKDQESSEHWDDTFGAPVYAMDFEEDIEYVDSADEDSQASADEANQMDAKEAKAKFDEEEASMDKKKRKKVKTSDAESAMDSDIDSDDDDDDIDSAAEDEDNSDDDNDDDDDDDDDDVDDKKSKGGDETQGKKKKKVKRDLWADWEEGGIRDRSGQIREIIMFK